MSALPAVSTSFGGLPEGFFSTVSSSVVEQLVWSYNAELKRIKQINEVVNSAQMRKAVDYYLRGSTEEHFMANGGFSSMANAIKVLNADYWMMAFNATDLSDHMPEKRRSEWMEAISKRDVPDFEIETVVVTLKDLLLERDNFLAERVDGIFRSLSGDHVTNVPEGFGKRMILKNVIDIFKSAEVRPSGYINDLRHVIAKFIGVKSPGRNDTMDVLAACAQHTGEWHEVDGGSLRVKTFKKGTVHLEIHPDMAWRLNEILAHLYPKAIPTRFRRRPEKKAKRYSLTLNLIPSDVRTALCGLRPKAIMKGHGMNMHRAGYVENVYDLKDRFSLDKHVLEKTVHVLEACGAEHLGRGEFFIDYNFDLVLEHLIVFGTIPDQKAHQFYPTPNALAERMVLWAEIDEHHVCVEPSAGQGNLALIMPGSVTAIEVSELNCKIMEKRGLNNPVQADFLEWAKGAELVDRVVMNPPFSQGRAEAHLTAAANLLRKDGVLVALVPSSIERKQRLPGFEYEWQTVERDEFEGVSIDMVLLKMTRKEYV